jgi:hypothetical protein
MIRQTGVAGRLRHSTHGIPNRGTYRYEWSISHRLPGSQDWFQAVVGRTVGGRTRDWRFGLQTEPGTILLRSVIFWTKYSGSGVPRSLQRRGLMLRQAMSYNDGADQTRKTHQGGSPTAAVWQVCTAQERHASERCLQQGWLTQNSGDRGDQTATRKQPATR